MDPSKTPGGAGGSTPRRSLIPALLVVLVGAALLYHLWPADWAVGERVYYSVFHSVSAFCNAFRSASLTISKLPISMDP